jgi:hypothetical protein
VCEYAIPGGRVRHRRRIEAQPERIVFIDELDGPAGQHLCELFWHPAAAAAEMAPDGVRLPPSFVLRAGPEAEIEQGWKSAAYGEKTEAPVVVVRRRGAFPMSFRTTLEALR